jgi:hypothetical protein
VITKFIEVTNIKTGGVNYGKFCVGLFDHEEWSRAVHIDDEPSLSPLSLLRVRGWRPREHVLVMDLQTGEPEEVEMLGRRLGFSGGVRDWQCGFHGVEGGPAKAVVVLQDLETA